MKTHFVTLHIFWPCRLPGTNQSRVDRKMCASKEGQSVRHDFHKASVPHFESGHIEISNRHVRRDASPCFSAHLCGGALQRVAPSPKHLNRRTQLDDGQGRRGDDHIGKCDWTSR